MDVARTRSLVALLMAVTGLLAVTTAGASAATPTLTGETFLDFRLAAPTPRVLAGTCNPAGTTTFTIQTDGAATGPYNGTYTETATVEIGPQTLPPVPHFGNFQGSYGFNVGPVLRYDASFRIDSVDADNSPITVTGTKAMSGRAPLPSTQLGPDPGNDGFCAEVNGEPITVPPFSPDTPALTGYFRGVDAASLKYTATIRTATGVYQDAGASRASARNVYAEFTAVPGSNAGRVDQFVEGFVSDHSDLQALTMENCKKDAWQLYEIFKNQGDCVSFVATGGGNEPAGL